MATPLLKIIFLNIIVILLFSRIGYCTQASSILFSVKKVPIVNIVIFHPVSIEQIFKNAS